jgi:hypothetical protein
MQVDMTTVTEAAPGTETLVPVTLIRASFRLAVERYPDKARWPLLATEGMARLTDTGGHPNLAPGEEHVTPDRAVTLLARAIVWGIPYCHIAGSWKFYRPDLTAPGCLSENPGCAECTTAAAARREFRLVLHSAIDDLESGRVIPCSGPAPATADVSVRLCQHCGNPIPVARGLRARFCKNGCRVSSHRKAKRAAERANAGASPVR